MTPNKKNSYAKESQLYGADYYKVQVDRSYLSAKQYANLLYGAFTPKTVVDIGCGRGTWLKAFREFGAETVVGFDGFWNTQENMVDDSIDFHQVDLNKPINLPNVEKFDLAMSLEVAEHLEPSSAKTFILTLAGMSDVVLFGAAYTHQGGTNHINEQPPTYWANIFRSHNYLPYDLFRPIVWGNANVEFWYQQNTFLYVREGSQFFQDVSERGGLFAPIRNVAFMDCVHPQMYQMSLKPGLKTSAKYVLRALLPAIKRRIVRGYRS